MDKELWEQYIKEQSIQIEYFEKHEHRGYDVKTGVRCAMNHREVSENYYQWCEKKLVEYRLKEK